MEKTEATEKVAHYMAFDLREQVMSRAAGVQERRVWWLLWGGQQRPPALTVL